MFNCTSFISLLHLSIIICLHIIIMYVVFLTNTNNFETYVSISPIYDLKKGTTTTTTTNLDIGVIEMKGFLTLSRASEQEPHYQLLFDVIPMTIYICIYILKLTSKNYFLFPYSAFLLFIFVEWDIKTVLVGSLRTVLGLFLCRLSSDSFESFWLFSRI